MSMYVKLAAAAAVAMGLAFGGTAAQAVPFTFQFVTGEGDPNILDGQIEVDVEVIDGGNQLQFHFTNDVENGVDASLTAITFQDNEGILSGIASITGSGFTTDPKEGVLFTEGNAPTVPGITEDFAVKAEPPPVKYGLDEDGEFLTVVFDLNDPMDLAAILALFESGDLAVAVHVQSIGGEDGFSQKLVNNPNPIPLPAGLVLFLSGLLGIGVLGRYKAKRREPVTA